MVRHLIASVLLTSACWAQSNLNESWFNELDSYHSQSFRFAETTPDGGVLSLGSARLSGKPGELVLLEAYAADGSFVWDRTLGDPNQIGRYLPLDLQIDGNGQPVLLLSNGSDLEIWKLQPDGSDDWMQTRVGGETCFGMESDNALAIGPDNSIYVARCDSQLLRYAPDGTFLWARPTVVDWSTDLIASPDGRVYTVGIESDYLSFGVTAFDPNGRVAWDDEQTGDIGSIIDISRVTLYPNGDVLLSSIPETFCGVFGTRLIRFDRDGVEQWKTDHPGHPCDALYVKEVMTDANGNAYIAGSVTDMRLVKFQPDGQMAWQRSFQTTPRQATVFDAAVTAQQHLVLTGEARLFGTPQDADVQTVWYDSNGDLLAEATYTDDSITGYALAPQPCGGVFVSGSSWPGPHAFTLRYPWIEPADLNGDERVDLADLAIMLGNFGGTGTPGDVDGDGTVTLSDLSAVLSVFGSGC